MDSGAVGDRPCYARLPPSPRAPLSSGGAAGLGPSRALHVTYDRSHTEHVHVEYQRGGTRHK